MLELLPDQSVAIEKRLRALGWITRSVSGPTPTARPSSQPTRTPASRERRIVLKQSVPFVAAFPDIAAPVERIEVEAAFYRMIGATGCADAMPRMLGYDPEFAFLGPREFDLGVLTAHLAFSDPAADDFTDVLRQYPGQADRSLVGGFAAVEILRRLLGVAQLPLQASLAQKSDWTEAR